MKSALGVAVIAVAASVGWSVPSAMAAPWECPVRGGELTMGISAQLPGLDPMFFPALITNQVARNIFEHLITRDEKLNPVLDLAESVQESADKLSYTFRLRANVKFHNGKTLTARDVAASFSRYKKLATNAALGPAESWSALDDRNFVVRVKEPTPTFLEGLSAVSALLVIMPEETPDLPNGERFRPIGTGPFEFVEWVPDSHVKLKRFAGYVPNPNFEVLNGFSGRKAACVDGVTLKIVPEAAARIAGLETGELDLVDDLPFKDAQVLKSNRNVTLASVKNWWNHHVQTNLQEPPTNNPAFRRAVQAALDMKEIMEIATDGAYSIHPGWLFPGQEYYTDVGKELYNQKNAERARQLLREAGYRGEEVIIATNTTYMAMHNAAQVMAEQLKAVGINAKLSVTDWATQLRRRKNPGYNYWTGGWPLAESGPVSGMSMFAFALNFNNLPAIDQELENAWQDVSRSPTVEGRKEAVARMQKRVYDQAYIINFGTMDLLQGTRSHVKNFVPFRNFRLYNVYLQK